MTLRAAVTQYVTFRKSLGERFSVNELALATFCRALGESASLADITVEAVTAHLAGPGPITAAWHIKHNALLGFYRYAISRGLVTDSPLPRVIPKRPPGLVPYIYSTAELRKLVKAADAYQRHRSSIPPILMRTLILLLYGAALRISEALALRLADVDLPNALITVHDSKFFKSRLVPLGRKLTRVLQEYVSWRIASGLPGEVETRFFVLRNGRPAKRDSIEGAFRRLCRHAGINRPAGSRWQPRLHDLRHSAAVHRVVSWYRDGKNVQVLLPHLAVYLGHAHLAATQAYLSMTPDLLREAGVRFEKYAAKEHPDD